MIDWSFILPIVLLAMVVALFFSQRARETFPYKARNFLLTDAEFAFYQVLEKSLSEGQMIAPKVRLGDVIECSDKDWARGFGPKISSKHLDFVIFEHATSRVLLGVELDDSSHTHPDRVARDKFVNKSMAAAGVPLLRVQVSRSYSGGDLKKDIAEMIETYERQRRD